MRSKSQMAMIARGNHTLMKSRAKTIPSALCTHCQRALPAKFQFVGSPGFPGDLLNSAPPAGLYRPVVDVDAPTVEAQAPGISQDLLAVVVKRLGTDPLHVEIIGHSQPML